MMGKKRKEKTGKKTKAERTVETGEGVGVALETVKF